MYAFIGGTPSAGKSYIAKKFIKESGLPIEYVEIDSFRKDFANKPELDKWVKVFSNKDEMKYWNEVTPEEHLKNLISQSEAFWSEIIKKVNEVKNSSEQAIFEAVNLLPHLVHKDFDFPGFFLVEENMETLLERLSSKPKWGETPEKQQLEARYFIEWEAKYIRKEAEKYNYPVFNNSDDALKALSKIFDETN